MSAIAYFISFRCHGTWLPGDARGWMRHATATSPTTRLPPNSRLLRHSLRILRHPPFRLNPSARNTVLATLHRTAEVRKWTLWESHVGALHVHLVVTADAPPERVMGSLKAWATRRMRERGQCGPTVRPWARHGSTIYLFTAEAVEAACGYVRENRSAERRGP